MLAKFNNSTSFSYTSPNPITGYITCDLCLHNIHVGRDLTGLACAQALFDVFENMMTAENAADTSVVAVSYNTMMCTFYIHADEPGASHEHYRTRW